MALSKPIRLLFITRRFPPSVGGMEKFAADLSWSVSQKTNLKLIKWGGSNKYLPFILPWFFVRASWTLLSGKIDIIHAQDGVVSVLCLPLKAIFRKPMVVVIHGLDITYKSWLYQFLIKKSLNRADHIICISHMAIEEVIKRGISADKVSFIPLGIKDGLNMLDKKEAKQAVVKELNIDSSSKIILSAGRLVKRKGVNWFISSVLPDLVRTDPNIIFAVSGGGPEYETIKQTVKKLGLKSNVRLLGQTSDELLCNLYNGCDVFVMPNIKVPGDMEGFGIVLLEAALCELPVVATGIEGITDAIIDGQNGILINEKNVASFTKEIKSLLDNPKKSHELGLRSRLFTLKNFAWDKVASQYVDEYNKLLN